SGPRVLVVAENLSMIRYVFGLLVCLCFCVTVPRAEALIAAVMPLQGVIGDSTYIFTVKVDSVDPDKPSMTLVLDEQLKDKAPFKELRVNLEGDADAKKLKHRDILLKRVAKDVTLVVFVVMKKNEYLAFAFTN